MEASMNSILRPVQQWAERCPDKLLFAFLDIDGRDDTIVHLLPVHAAYD